jgi:4-diphosphocytidyl-2-C-methyl-D-erythritol kinase
VPAKLNLYLGVGELRADGFHELVTVFHAVDLEDEIRVRPAAGLHLEITGEGAGSLPGGPGNIAWRAAELLAEHASVPADARIEIHKSIPVAGGLAGGSADAAATLVGCAELWRTGTTQDDLALLAARLGSDVAFALIGGTALGTGRGEQLRPVPTAGTLHWVLAAAGFGLSTPEAYAELDRQRGAGGRWPYPPLPQRVLEALRAGDTQQLAAVLANDLQPAALALAPTLHHTIEAGRAAGALAGIVSGSGPTVAFLCADAAAAQAVAAGLSAVCRSAVIARGPTPGARVLAAEGAPGADPASKIGA